MRCFSSFEYELVYYTAVLWVVMQRSSTQTPFGGRSVAWRHKDTTRIDLPSSRNQWIRTPKLHCFETALQDGLRAPSTRIQTKNMWFQLSGNYARVRVDMAQVQVRLRNFVQPAEFQKCSIVPIVCQQLDLRVRLVWDFFFSSARTWFQKLPRMWCRLTHQCSCWHRNISLMT